MHDRQSYDNLEAAQGCRCCEGGSRSTTPVGGGTVTDPVCGMRVHPLTSRYRLEHGGESYFFCCERCRTAFAASHTA